MATLEERHPELFRPVSNESPRGKKRTVPLECLCLGFNRTGTASMCSALETLGLPCWHSTQFLSTRFGDIEMWQEAVDRKFFGAGPKFGRAEFDQLLHDYGAVSSDTPAIAFAEDLVEAYPEAKVVLVERDIDSWYQSWMDTVIKNTYSPVVTLVCHIDRFFTRPIGNIHKTTFKGWAGISGPEDAPLKSKAKYREHYALVRRVTSKDRLLEFKLSDGWEPLCEFLGKPVPDKPFPHINEKKWLDEKVQLVLMRGMNLLAWKVLIYFLAPILAAGLLYYGLM
ncbi:sulfotransferase family protein [Aspergillus aculeatinus CBS 121060]|uniref:Efflux pump antibiotic resistance protein n=1 Tax=Aspergillus aculeatinus CBS 121060 TaxID=1448322 RepID=A0ACD1HNN0_9EURO|nr:efflux pump antibiotic resistance protein [Aspergillus aculeatinus CBS 121060]RAH75062.1 efflux pump antibiotic resistance protein [Aspergillus aculeatinus CBS 121060]